MTRAALGHTSVAIASESRHTVEAGRQIAELGGNAVDIAVASALAATVSEALMCSLGGSAFIHIKHPGRDPELIDGADAMPRVPERELRGEEKAWRIARVPYGDGIAVNVGHASVAVPGMLRALELAWERHGSLPWAEVLKPAIALARDGVSANQTLVMWLGMAGRVIFYEQAASRAVFFPDGEKPLRKGEWYRQAQLGDSLEHIARHGADALYIGDLAKAFSDEITAHGGYVTRDDLASYAAQVRTPLLLTSHGYHLALNPPPSIGGAMVGSMMNMYDMHWSDAMSEAERVLLLARVQRAMFYLRHQEGGGDWDDERAGQILERAWLEEYFHKTFSPNTMHMSVATGDGGVVAITMSNGYGSGITIPGTGIHTNNSLGEPELNPAGYFRIRAGGRMVSNMAPTVVWDDRGTQLAMGSPGASRITTSILQGWTRFGYEKLTIEDAVRAPRLHVENIGGRFVVQHEPGIDVSLAGKHFALRAFDAPDMYFGALNVAGIDENGSLHAIGDRRRQGSQFVSGS